MFERKNNDEHLYEIKESLPGQESVVIDSATLLCDRNEIQICHEGEMYRLRVTKNGKLILNK